MTEEPAPQSAATSIPWVEKYRPTRTEDIVLDPVNRAIVDNIIRTARVPNLLIYGPPGTGKTTTIVNIVHQFQKTWGHEPSPGMVIHLNASDERGVDAIRSQIHQFIVSGALYNNGPKFVILDEVDYMTKTAQQELKCMLQTQPQSVRFFLICNYVSRIEGTLRAMFVQLRFSRLPADTTHRYLTRISRAEGVRLTPASLSKIHEMFGSDMRSMINFLQLNRDFPRTSGLVQDATWAKLCGGIARSGGARGVAHIRRLGESHNMSPRTVVHRLIEYITKHVRGAVTPEFLALVSDVVGSPDVPEDVIIPHAVERLRAHLPAVAPAGGSSSPA